MPDLISPLEILDVLVIGAGGAGLSAAIEATLARANTLVVTGGDTSDGKTASAQGGIQASFHPDDHPDLHFEDTMRAGNQRSNPDLVRLLVDRSRETIRWLERCGVTFDLDRDGENYRMSKAAGLSRPRVLSSGDMAGKGIVRAVVATAREAGVKVREHTAVTAIDPLPGGGFRVSLRNGNGSDVLETRTIVLATGGAQPAERRAGLVHKGMNGHAPDGLELAEALGARIVNPELQQFHPTGIVLPASLRRMRLPETFRADGADLFNRHGEKFLDPMLPRNQVSAAIVAECERGNGVETEDGFRGVWLDTPSLKALKGPGYIARRYPTFDRLFREQGHDMERDPVLVYPIVHYSLGGVEIDADAMSSVPGLFAAGEVTWGIHGEDRLMGNSLLDIFVFGRIAGRAAAARAAPHDR